ncbi:DUF5690 family protein [Zavarzinella formosa]|uniref:DUF5690 family protein n=1 Tax=Zavarzinella formosa TaxID=360055 RepID=UPI000307D885|nr:DUF5690 family protein [Zavarzinella formosa]
MFVAYALTASFITYFCIYGLRKPFDALAFPGEKYLGTRIDLKTACVLGQIIGYMLSKYAGAWACAETPRRWRAALLLGVAGWAELMLLAITVLPPALWPLALFGNGLPLGIVWGLVVRYLEGRRISDMLLVGVSTAFLMAGAATKDVALWILAHDVPREWMPAVAGFVFLVPYAIGVALLDHLPAPTLADETARSVRANVGRPLRRVFLRHFGLGLIPLFGAYFLLTAYRDFRDLYGRELLLELGYPGHPGLFMSVDIWAVGGALVALACLNLVHDHRRALAVVCGFVLAGFAVIGLSTLGFRAGRIDGLEWVAAVGVGLYLAYVPFGVVLFERLVAAARFPGTSVFAVQLADGVGYSGSVLIQLFRDVAFSGTNRLEFFVPLSYAVSVAGIVFTLATAGLIGPQVFAKKELNCSSQ